MKTYLDCIPCFIRQALSAVRMATDDAATHLSVLRTVLQDASRISVEKSPVHIGREIHAIVRHATGEPDPYRDVKDTFNRIALNAYPGLQDIVRKSENPFETAVKLAIAGNIIDFAVMTEHDTDILDRTVSRVLEHPLVVDDIPALKRDIDNAERILYLADNAGEIVLDKLLVEQLPKDKTTLAVRGAPVINDATLNDARAVGMTDLVKVIDNGSDAPGTLLETCSPEFVAAYRSADVIIAKGQGNYETLSDTTANAYFLFMVKCPVVANDIGGEVGGVVVKQAGVRHRMVAIKE